MHACPHLRNPVAAVPSFEPGLDRVVEAEAVRGISRRSRDPAGESDVNTEGSAGSDGGSLHETAARDAGALYDEAADVYLGTIYCHLCLSCLSVVAHQQ